MSGHDDIYRQAARLRALTLAVRMPDDESQALRDIADALDAIGDGWAADEGDYAKALSGANDEIARLRDYIGRLAVPGSPERQAFNQAG